MQQKADFGKIKIAKPQLLKQTNDDDCGLFVVHYVEKILGLVELYAVRDSLANLDDQRFPVEEVFCVYVCLCCLKVNAKRCDLRASCLVWRVTKGLLVLQRFQFSLKIPLLTLVSNSGRVAQS